MQSHSFEFFTIGLCAVLSAFFSGSETALFALKKSDLHRFSHSASRIERGIYRLMLQPQNILITILIGNLLVNFILAMLSTELLLGAFPRWGHVISILVVTPLLIVVSEISPKILSINAAIPVARKVYPLLTLIHRLLYPIRVALLFFTDNIVRIFRISMEDAKITTDELDHAIRIGEEEGVIDPEEGDFIKNVLMFSRLAASNVMFPRNTALFIPYGTSIQDAVDMLRDYGFNRAPVYRKNYDDVLGYIDGRELVPYAAGQKKARNINRFIHEIKFYPESRELNDLLHDFLNERIKIAIVVDEYGGTAGVVYLNAILAQLMGREFNRWETRDAPEVRSIGARASRINGNMQIHEFNRIFGEDLESLESETMGGFLCEKLGHLPLRGEEISTEKYLLRVRRVLKHRVVTIEVIKRGEE